MSHINHHRGETRRSINKSGTSRRRSKGLAKRAQLLAGFGIRNWCGCCQPMNPKDPYAKKWVSRLDRIDGQRLCNNWEEDMPEY